MEPLTEKQQKVFRFIEKRLEADKPPSQREVAERFGLAQNAAYQIIGYLKNKGYLTDLGGHRGIRLSQAYLKAKKQTEGVPIVGAVAAGDADRLEDEVGDLLFVVVNLARKLGQDPEIALRRTNQKFLKRFQAIEKELAGQGKSLDEATLEEMDALWETSKRKEPGR